MKIKRRPGIKNHGVLKNRKKRLLQQQRCRSAVYFKQTEGKFESIDWHTIDIAN